MSRSWLAPVNGVRGDGRNTFTGELVGQLAAVFEQPLTVMEKLLKASESDWKSNNEKRS